MSSVYYIEDDGKYENRHEITVYRLALNDLLVMLRNNDAKKETVRNLEITFLKAARTHSLKRVDLFGQLVKTCASLLHDRNLESPSWGAIGRVLSGFDDFEVGRDTLDDLLGILAGVSKDRQYVFDGNMIETTLGHLVENDTTRRHALRAHDELLARNALIDVVGDLRDLIDSVASFLHRQNGEKCPAVALDAVRYRLAYRTLSALPLRQVAEILDLSVLDLHRVLARAPGATTHGDLEKLFRTGLAQLREKLDEIEETDDHALLDVVLRIVSNIAIGVAVAIAAAPVAALAVGDSLMAETIKAAITAFITLALYAAVESIQRRRLRQPYLIAQGARRELVNALADFSEVAPNLSYRHYRYSDYLDATTAQIRLIFKTYVAKKSLLEIDMVDKLAYWNELTDLERLAADSDQVTTTDWRSARRRIRSVRLANSAPNAGTRKKRKGL